MASFNANMAKEFSNQQTYKYGDYCMNEKTLYRHTNPEDTKGPFDEKDWTVTNLFPLVQGKYELDNTNNLAPAYESGRSYSKDDVVDKNGLLYICTVDSSKDTWDETEWDLTNLTELTQYNSQISGGKAPELIWTNPNPSANFAAQTLNLDLSKYSGVLVEFNRSGSSYQNLCSRVYLKKSDNAEYFGAGHVVTSGYARNVAIKENGIEFGASKANTTVDNDSNIPVRIYGVYGSNVDLSGKDVEIAIIVKGSTEACASLKTGDSSFIAYNGAELKGNYFSVSSSSGIKALQDGTYMFYTIANNSYATGNVSTKTVSAGETIVSASSTRNAVVAWKIV